MTFDKRLEETLETLTGRIREEVARQVRLVGDELTAAARAEPAPVDRGAEMARLAEGIRAIGSARTLTEILEALIRSAAQEAARVGVLLVRGDLFTGWRFQGFTPPFENPTEVQELPSGQRSVVLPIAIGGQTVAVLYADAGPNQNPEPGTENPEPGTRNPEPGTLNPEPLEILAGYASRCLEALTAIKAARSLTDRPESQAPPAEAGDDEHVAARRYARILVSEIKLYHEEQVAAGRRKRDLATRLGGEIARVRALYEQRVPPDVRQGTDYVHEELIRTLADGDASLLEVKT